MESMTFASEESIVQIRLAKLCLSEVYSFSVGRGIMIYPERVISLPFRQTGF